MNIIFSKTACEQYIDWQKKDKKILKKINDLIKDISRNGVLEGIGKPEKLKHFRRDLYSRRITSEHRLVYNIDKDNNLIIYACMGHYMD